MTQRTALVTGASRGIGKAVAEALRASGAKVLAPARAELELGSEASISAYLSSLKEPVDILVNNAGINRLGASHEVKAGDFEETLRINLMAPFKLAAALGQGMKQRGWGRIVNISSIWGLVVRERRVTYAASKAGVIGLTRALAVELAPHGVLVNSIAPGYINTELTKQNNSPAEIEAISKAIPMGRLGEPAEIAELVAFLCSERNTYLTGQVLACDGGYTCK